MVFLEGGPKKKPPGFRLAVFSGILGLSLAGPFRQEAGEIEETEEEPARHVPGFKHESARLSNPAGPICPLGH
jgi:hypothetical protein